MIQPLTAHDLAADWKAWRGANGFRVARGSVVWETAEYPERPGGNDMTRVRIQRLEATASASTGIRVFTRYVDPDTRVILET